MWGFTFTRPIYISHHKKKLPTRQKLLGGSPRPSVILRNYCEQILISRTVVISGACGVTWKKIWLSSQMDKFIHSPDVNRFIYVGNCCIVKFLCALSHITREMGCCGCLVLAQVKLQIIFWGLEQANEPHPSVSERSVLLYTHYKFE